MNITNVPLRQPWNAAKKSLVTVSAIASLVAMGVGRIFPGGGHIWHSENAVFLQSYSKTRRANMSMAYITLETQTLAEKNFD